LPFATLALDPRDDFLFQRKDMLVELRQLFVYVTQIFG
jgi:hypothetical protein